MIKKTGNSKSGKGKKNTTSNNQTGSKIIKKKSRVKKP